MLKRVDLTKNQILQWLEAVKDPEIPVLSLVDLGVITSVKVNNNSVEIDMTPTFVGCPAIDYMKSDIHEVLEFHGSSKVTLTVTLSTP